MNYFTPSNLSRSGFIGIDVNPKIALHDYGVLSRKCRQGENKGKFEVVVPAYFDHELGKYDGFSTRIFDDINDAVKYYDWINASDIENYADFKISKLGNNVYDINLFMYDIMSYYGCENL